MFPKLYFWSFGSFLQNSNAETLQIIEKRARNIKEQDKFKLFDIYQRDIIRAKDVFLNHIAGNKGFAYIYYKSSLLSIRLGKFNYNSKGEKILHEGSESTFPEWHGKVLRKNYLYLEQVQTLYVALFKV